MQVVLLSIPLILTVATFYVSKAINVWQEGKDLSNLILIGQIVVKSVEQTWNGISSELKLKKAIELMRKMGIDGTDEQLTTIIESTVKHLTSIKLINTDKEKTTD